MEGGDVDRPLSAPRWGLLGTPGRAWWRNFMLGPRRQRDGAFYAPSSPPPATPRSPPTTPPSSTLSGTGWPGPLFGLATLLHRRWCPLPHGQRDPRAVEEGTRGIKSALIGYALAALAPTLLSIILYILR